MSSHYSSRIITSILQGNGHTVKNAYCRQAAHKVIAVAHSIGGECMTDTIEERACEVAVYMIETGATVRTAAKHFRISKSTVHTVVAK